MPHGKNIGDLLPSTKDLRKKLLYFAIKEVDYMEMRIVKFDNREELKKFLESDDPVAQLAEEEGTYFGDSCDNCDEEFEVIISGGRVNYYLCSEHFSQLKEKLGPLSSYFRDM